MTREKNPLTPEEFDKYRTKLFAQASDELKAFVRKLADYCWSMDEFAVVQEWGGEKEALIVFGVPPEYRKRSNAKNYFSIYKVANPSDQSIKCEVCFPIDSSREKLLRQYDTNGMLHISTIKQCEGQFKPEDFNYVKKLINVARCHRIG